VTEHFIRASRLYDARSRDRILAPWSEASDAEVRDAIRRTES
jgi:hypothetical protein